MSFNLKKVKSASAELLCLLDQLAPSENVNNRRTTAPQRATPFLDEHRMKIDDLSKQLEKCSWSIAILLHSLDEIRETRRLITQKRGQVLDQVNELLAANPSTVHLPNEVLAIIAQYVYSEPISIMEAVKLESSGCKWDKIVLKSSVILLEGHSLRSRFLPKVLSTSSPAKLIIDLGYECPRGEYHPDEIDMQLLLPYLSRWHALQVDEWEGDSLKKQIECGNQNVFPCLDTFTTFSGIAPPFTWMTKNLRHLRLIPKDNYLPINFSDIAVEALSISELTVLWRIDDLDDLVIVQPQHAPAYFPLLRRVVFVQAERGSCLRWLRFAFGSLDCSSVEDLSVHIMPSHFEDPDADPRGMMKYLGDTFPSVKSLALRAETPSYRTNENVLKSQRKFLETLLPPDGEEPIFLHLTHLTLESDPSKAGIDALLQVLNERYDYRGTSGPLPDIKSLQLVKPVKVDTTGDSLPTDELIDKVKACVPNVTFCNPHSAQTYWYYY